MTRGRFYVFRWDGEIMLVEGWKCAVSAQNGNTIDVGIFRPANRSRCWYISELTSGLNIGIASTRGEAITIAEEKSPAVYRIIEDADNPKVNDPVTVRFREFRERMTAYVKEQAEKPFE